jgi:hypothetical protein
MSSTTIELFRRHIENHRQEAQELQHKQRAQERTETKDNPNLVVEMSRIEHQVRRMFNDASPAERNNMICFLELLVRNLKQSENTGS